MTTADDIVIGMTALNMLATVALVVIGWKAMTFVTWVQTVLLPWVVKVGQLLQDDYDHPTPPVPPATG